MTLLTSLRSRWQHNQAQRDKRKPSARRGGWWRRRVILAVEPLEERVVLSNQADLVISAALAPATAVVGNAQKISVSWTVKNQGNAAALAKWRDAVYFSDQPILDTRTATFVDSLAEDFQSPLATGASYTVQRLVTVPNTATGNRYIIFQTNQTGSQPESDTTNNTLARPITLTTPGNIDLKVTDATTPATAVVGNGTAVTVTYTVQNQGTVAALGPWTDAVYISDKPTFDTSAVPVASADGNPRGTLAAGANYTVHRTFTVPNTAPGSRYLLFVANPYHTQAVVDSSHGVLARPIQLNTPGAVDLRLLNATAPAAAVVGNGATIDVSYTVKNQGSVTAQARWNDAIYLSDHNTLDSSATLVDARYGENPAPLPAGASYTIHKTLTVPNTSPGSRFLLFVADQGNNQYDTDRSNNVFAVPITLTAPNVDLAVVSATAPATAVVGDNSSIAISYTVKNQGTDKAQAGWADAVYLSDKPTFDSSAQEVGFEQYNVPEFLAGGASYTIRSSVFLGDTVPGNRYLLFHTNVRNIQYETDKASDTNNTFAVPITFTRPDADLAITNVSAPATVVVGNGAGITLSWTVKNQGTAPARTHWYDAVFLADDPTYRNGLTFLTGGYSDQAPLAAGASYTTTRTVTVPNTATGARYLLFVTDQFDAQGETSKANNIMAMPITLTAPQVDLALLAATAPATAVEGATVAVSWTVKNQGSEAARGAWSDAIYVSDYPTLDSNATQVAYTAAADKVPLAAGASYTRTQNLVIPNTATGARYLLFVTNAFTGQSETNPDNNVFAVPITLTAPDLAVTALTAPATAVLGDTIPISWSVQNQGSVPAAAKWYDYLYLSENPFLDPGNPYPYGAVRIATVDASAKSPLAAGASYTLSANVFLPSTTPGARYLIVVADGGNQQGKINPRHTVFAIPITLTAPDLTITTATAPATAVLGNKINVSWTVKNQGTVPARAHWFDAVYVSDNQAVDRTATFVAEFSAAGNAPLAPGASYTAMHSITLPDTAIGRRYLVFVTDAYNSQGETDKKNNSFAMPITLSAPDLTVTAATAPASVTVGQTFAVSYTVKNQGSVAAPARWSDGFYISDRPYLDYTAQFITSFSVSDVSPLAAGASYSRTHNLTLPATAVGNRYLLMVADVHQDQPQPDRSHTVYAVPITVIAPDLTVATAMAPASITLGQTVSVSYTVKNQGSVAAPAEWSDGFYISDKAVLDSTAERITSFSVSDVSPLAAGASYSRTRNLTLPVTRTGSRYLLVVTDVFHDQQPPTAHSYFAIPITVTAPDLTVIDAMAPAMAVVGNGASIALSYTVKNQGTVAAPARWTDAIYLSDKNMFDDSARQIDYFYEGSHAPLDPGASYTQTANLVLGNLPAGSHYLLFVADAYHYQEAAGNPHTVLARTIMLVKPDVDLVVTTAMAPATVIESDSVPISFTVKNQGTVAANGSWYDAIYVSDDSALHDNSTFVTEFSASSHRPLAPGGSYTVNQNIHVPITKLGVRYLLFVANADHAQGETNETNNIFAVRVTITAPDLIVTNVSAPPTATLNKTISVSWTVKNQGTVKAPGKWYDAVYISDKTTLDYTAELVTTVSAGSHSPLDPGASYMITQNVTIPNTTPGNRYLIVQTDYYNSQGETDKTNNTLAVPIQLVAPNADLIVTTVMAPATAILGDTIPISYTVKNQGDLAATGHWSDAIFLSDHPTLDDTATFVTSISAFDKSPLAPNDTYTITRNVFLPGTATGNRYLLVEVNYQHDQSETNYDNNILARPITLTAPDLALSSASGPPAAILGDAINVSWTVKNIGTVPALSRWYDAIYLSGDRFVNDASTLVATFLEGPLAAGASYTAAKTVTLPSSGIGNRFLLFVTNYDHYQPETNYANNVFAVPITLTAAHLNVTAATAPSGAAPGATIGVSWTVKNDGNAPAKAHWFDAVYLADSTFLDGSATLLAKFSTADQTPLAAGTSYTLNKNVTIPNVQSGSRYLLFVANDGRDQIEVNRDNHVFALPIQIGRVELDLTALAAPSSALFGQAITLSWTVRNSGVVPLVLPWSDKVYLSTTNRLDANAVVLYTQTSADVVPLAAGAAYTRTVSVTLPLNTTTTNGTYYLFVKTDALDQVPQSDRSNTVKSQALALTLPPLPDLVVTGLSAPAQGETGQNFLVSWSDKNQGTAAATGTWVDRVYLSPDTQVSHGTLAGEFTFTGTLAVGDSVQRTGQLRYPSTAGSYYVIVVTNATNTIQEGPGLLNNTTVTPTPITVRATPLADLVVTSITAPPNGVLSGQTTTITFVVKNQGAAPTSVPVWLDYVFISQDPNITFPSGNPPFDDQLINNQPFRPVAVENASALDVGQSYTQNVQIRLPIDASGPWYAYAVANGLGFHFPAPTLPESDRTNNLLRSGMFNIGLTSPPALQVTQVQAPAQALSGQPMSVSWTVTNGGPGPTAASAWTDEIFMSPNKVLDDKAVPLGRFPHNGALRPGEGYQMTQTVTLPIGVSGSFYFLVKTDVNKQVFQNGQTDKNVGSTAAAVTVNLTPPPDLEVDTVTAPATALASHAFAITYHVRNAGSSATPNSSWTDAFYLSPNPRLDPTRDPKLGEVTHQGALAAGDAYSATVTFTLPDGLSGTFHVFAFTDSGNVVFEINKTNNIGTAAGTTQVQSRPADLVVAAASAPSIGTAGSAIPVSWTVKNQGIGDTAVANWVDKIYATTDPVLGSNRIFLGTFPHNGLLDAGATYSQTALVNLPITLTGHYNLFVYTDAPLTRQEDGKQVPNGSVYESNKTNNISAALPITLTQALAQLQVTQVSAPATAATGASLTVSWTVKNLGAGRTNATYWYDDVYLSTKPVIGTGTDLYLGSFFHANALDPQAQYSATGTVLLPVNLAAGNYYVIIRVDHPVATRSGDPNVRLVLQSSRTNNDVAAPMPTQVALSPTPDLAPTGIMAPASIFSGQSFTVTWTVRNAGAATGNTAWHDSVYLSLDQVFDRINDRYLGSVDHNGGLGAAQSYTQSGTFQLPLGVTGTFYVFVVADSGGNVYERGSRARTVAFDPQTMKVVLAPPVDLVAGTITVPPNAVPGMNITLTYHVSNQSANAAQGDWDDALYLATGTTWDFTDPLLGTVHHTGGVAAHGSYMETLTAPLPGVAPGSYHVILRTNIRRNVAETNLDNNISASLDKVSIDVDPLSLGVPKIGTLGQGQSVYYKVLVDPGQTLQVRFASQNAQAVNELYLRYGTLPSRSQYDFRYDQPLAANQQLVVPTTQAGTYYVLAYGASLSGSAAGYTITAALIPFSVQAVKPGEVGNAGPSTLEIVGAKFNRDTTFQLIGAGSVIQATAVQIQNTSTALATFDLTGHAVGVYSLRAVDKSQGTAQLDQALSVRQGHGGQLANTITGDTFPLAGRVSVLNVNYTNTGDADLAVPFFTLESPTQSEFGLTPDSTLRGNTLVVMATNPNGLAGILKPGDQISVPIYFRAARTAGVQELINVRTFSADDTDPINWPVVFAWLPSTASMTSAVLAQLKKQIGTTWGDLVRALARDATLMPSTFGSNREITNLLEIEVGRALAAVGTSLSGMVHATGLDIAIAGRVVYAHNSTTNELFSAVALNDGSFVIPQVTPGVYELSFDGAIVKSPATVTVARGQAVQGVVMDLARGARIAGSVFLTGTSSPIASALITATGGNGTIYTAQTDSNGKFALEGLPPGTYTLLAHASGYARTLFGSLVLGDADVVQNITMQKQSVITGQVNLPPGGPGASVLNGVTTAVGGPFAGQAFSITFSGTSFAIFDLPAGSYSVTVRGAGYLSASVANVTVGAGLTTDIGTINLTLPASISGSVTTSDPLNPLRTAVVQVFSGATPVARVPVNAGGVFTIPNLGPGTYTLNLNLTQGFAASQTVTVRAGDQLTGIKFNVQPGGVIAGKVTEQRTGGAISHLYVFAITPDGSGIGVFTDNSGAYTFQRLSAGAYRVFLPIAVANDSQIVTVADLSGTTTVTANFNVDFPYTTKITGQILDSHNMPLGNIWVDLLQNNVTVASAFSGADGTYTFVLRAGGTFALQAQNANGTFALVSGVTVTNGGTAHQNIVEGSSSLQVRARDAAGPVGGVAVRLYLKAGSGTIAAGTQQLDSNGQALFTNLTPGNYVLFVDGTGEGVEQTVAVVGSGLSAASVVLAPEFQLMGQIVLTSGSPVSNAQIRLTAPSDPSFLQVTSSAADGSYSFSNVPSGAYDIVVVAEGFQASVQTSVAIIGSKSLKVTLAVSTTTASGSAIDTTGQPIFAGVVNVEDSSGHPIGQAKISALGSFTLTTASGNNLTLRILATGFVPKTVTGVNIVAGSTVQLGQFQLQPLALDPSDAGASISLPAVVINPSNPGFAQALLDAAQALIRGFGHLAPVEPPPNPKCPGCEGLYAAANAAAKQRDNFVDHTLRDLAQTVISDATNFFIVYNLETAVFAGAVAGIALSFIVSYPALFTALSGASTAFISFGPGLITTEAEIQLFAAYTVTLVQGFIGKMNSISSDLNATASAQSFSSTTINASKTIKDFIQAVLNLKNFFYGSPAYNPGGLGGLAKWYPPPLAAFVSLVTTLISDPWQNSRQAAEQLDRDNQNLQQALKVLDKLDQAARKAKEAYDRCLASQAQMDCMCMMDPENWKKRPLPFPKIPLPWPWIPHLPHDPNDIIGPTGFGDQGFITATQPLPYKILFENQASATAPAQQVTITEQLDPHLDWRTFRLGDFGWGSLRFQVPANSAFYQQRIDLTQQYGFFVDVFATINIQTGVATWIITTIDPATGEKPADGRKGFLPPDDANGIGEGFVSYTILPRQTVQTGDVIYAQARVIFDTEEPIDTPRIFNTIDLSVPASPPTPLPPNQPGPQFTVSWSGTTDPKGSAIQDFTIYVSDNGGPLTPFLVDTTLTQAVFTGQPGHTYTFYVMARSNVGNETTAPQLLATTRVANQVASATAVPVSVTEGQTFSGVVATFTTVSAVGPLDDFTATITWGDGHTSAGVITASAGGFSVSGSYIYAEAGNYTITVTITDRGGRQVSASSTARVADAALAATFGSISGIEGMALSGVVASFRDPNSAAVVGDFSAVIQWGDGTTSAGVITASGGGFTVVGSHTYAAAGAYPITVTITDRGGRQATAAGTAQVADAGLAATFGSVSAVEGAAWNGALASFHDANTSAVAGDFSATISWGDGMTSAGTISAGSGGFTISGSHSYAEEGSYTVSITITDRGGAHATVSGMGQVADAALSAAFTSVSAVQGRAFSGVVATFQDVNPQATAADFSATIIWGDGQRSAGVIAASGGFTVTGSHTYATSGTFPVTVQITDHGGSSASANGKANVQALAVRPGSPALFAIGGTPGRVQVRRVGDGALLADFAPYGSSYTGSVSVAIGDINGDGFPDLVTGATVGNPHVKVYSGKAFVDGTFNAAHPDASLITAFFAYGLNFNIGANVAVGAVRGDGFADIITGATAGNPHVKVFSGKAIAQGTFNPAHPDASLVTQFFAYGLNFNIGVNVAVGDISHDGFADIVTGATAGNPQVKVYDGKAIAQGTFNPARPDASLLASWFAFGLQFNLGVNVAVGDVNGDGFADIVTGATAGNPQVKIYDGQAVANHTLISSAPDRSLLDQFYAYELGADLGVTVGAADFEGTGRADILTGAVGGPPHLRIVRGNATGVQPAALFEVMPSDLQGGTTVGG